MKQEAPKWTPWGATAGILVLVAIIGGAIAMVMVAQRGATPKARPPRVAAPIAEVTATELISSYSSNELAADAQYKGKTVRVAGELVIVGRDTSGDPYLTIGQGYPTFRAGFEKKDERTLLALKPGDFIKVECEIKGHLIEAAVIGERCQVAFKAHG